MVGTIGPSLFQGPALISEGSGTGDGTTVAFAMGFSAINEKDVDVYVDGVKQNTDVYTVSGSTCTFTTAPTNNETLRFFKVQTGYPTVPQDGSVDSSKINTSSISPIVQIQSSNTTAVVTCNTVLPYDDTIPQNTEGTEVLTVTITPKSATNKLIIEFNSSGAISTAGLVAGIALFQDSTAGALAAGVGHYSSTSVTIGRLALRHEMAAGTTSATTFKIRIGPHVAGSVYPNGVSAGTRAFGGVSSTFLTVTEVLQ